MKRINILTSCDDNLAKFILPQLVSIEKNLHEYDVHFFLAHYRISQKNMRLIEDFIDSKTNITFHEVLTSGNLELYSKLSRNAGGQWPAEAYFTLRLQDYLPEDVDRVLYIDAGDVIIDGDIAPYYFDDFEGKSIIATPLKFKKAENSDKVELFTNQDILTVSKGSLFNSGSYVINVERFRCDGYTIEDYTYLDEVLLQNAEPGKPAYFGDQGFLAAAFAGDIKFYGYPEHSDPSYMPYNFRTSYWGLYKQELYYTPVVVHYAIISKPWVVRFSDNVINEIIDTPNFVSNHLVVPIPPIAYITPHHLRMCELWWKYAIETPIYDEANTRATITAENWLKYYLPICVKYIDASIYLKKEQDKNHKLLKIFNMK